MPMMRHFLENRIGILIGSLEVGGAQVMALRLMQLLTRKGASVFLFSLDKNFDVQLPGDEETQKKLLSKIIFLSRRSVVRGAFYKSLSAVGIYFKLEHQLRKKKIDVVISFMERANILNLMLTAPKVRIISIRIHMQRLKQKILLKQWLIKCFYPLLLSRAQFINFNSVESAYSFRSEFSVREKRISIIHNFCNIEMLRKKSLLTVEWKYDQLFKNPVVVSSGRLLRQKGHLELIRSFAMLCRNNHRVCLLIIGDGPLRKELLQLIRILGINERVVIAAFQNNLMACIKKARCFVLSSHVEGFPNVLLEAMAIGLPVISTDCSSGPRELLAPGTDPLEKTNTVDLARYGVLTPPFNDMQNRMTDPLSLAETQLCLAMQLMLENKDMQANYKKMATLRARMFSEKVIQKKWADLFERADSIREKGFV